MMLSRGILASARLPLCRTIGTSATTALVGLPNVGKSTILNACAENASAAQVGNYPFCTIEANRARVVVPDRRLAQLKRLYAKEGAAEAPAAVSASLEFIDVAGLVKGAADGEGLGNKFLADIKAADAIVHVVRCFEDSSIIHVDESASTKLDPGKDAEIIRSELALADVETIERRLVKLKSKGAKEMTSAVRSN